MTNIGSHDDRIAFGKQVEEELKTKLESVGCIVTRFGQENYLKNPAHERLRHIHNDPTVRAIRFAPDFIVVKPPDGTPPVSAYWEAKGNFTPNTPNFSLQIACHEELLSRHEKGEICIVAFKDTGNLWYANYIQNLVILPYQPDRTKVKGSRTPLYLLRKHCTQPFDNFLKSWISGSAPMEAMMITPMSSGNETSKHNKLMDELKEIRDRRHEAGQDGPPMGWILVENPPGHAPGCHIVFGELKDDLRKSRTDINA